MGDKLWWGVVVWVGKKGRIRRVKWCVNVLWGRWGLRKVENVVGGKRRVE